MLNRGEIAQCTQERSMRNPMLMSFWFPQTGRRKQLETDGTRISIAYKQPVHVFEREG